MNEKERIYIKKLRNKIIEMLRRIEDKDTLERFFDLAVGCKSNRQFPSNSSQ